MSKPWTFKWTWNVKDGCFRCFPTFRVDECLGHLYKTQPSTLKKTSIKGGVDTSPRKRNESDANKNNNLMNALVSSIAPKYFISSNLYIYIYTYYIRFKTATWFWVNDVNVKNTFDRRWALSPVTNGVKLTPMACASSDGYMGAAPNVSNSIKLGQYNSEIMGIFPRPLWSQRLKSQEWRIYWYHYTHIILRIQR